MQAANTVYFNSLHPIYRREIAVYQSKADGRTIQWGDVSLKKSEVLISADLSRATLQNGSMHASRMIKYFESNCLYDGRAIHSGVPLAGTIGCATPHLRIVINLS